MQKKLFPLLAANVVAAAAIAQGPITYPEYVCVTFAELPGQAGEAVEGTELSNQFEAGYGISFLLADDVRYPIIVRAGDPAVAFVDNGSSDSPLSPGLGFGMTDPLGPGGALDTFRSIRVRFDPPIVRLRLFFPRVAGQTTPVLNGVLLDGSVERVERDNGGNENFWSNSRAWSDPALQEIRTELAQGSSSAAYAMGQIVAIRPPQEPLTGPFIRVAQETTAGRGDFNSSVVGVIRATRSPQEYAPRAQDIYLYQRAQNSGESYGGIALPARINHTSMSFHDMAEGNGVGVVHNRRNQGGRGGSAAMRWSVQGSTGSLTFPVRDDPPSDTFEVSGNEAFTSNGWAGHNTDGYVLTGFAGEWEALAWYEAAPTGLDSWSVSSSDLAETSLVIEPGRRVQFKAVDQCVVVASPSDRRACTGGSAAFSASGFTTVSANSPIAYQWRRNQIPLNPLSNPTATSPTLLIDPVEAADFATYDCVVSNACGSVMSLSAALIECDLQSDVNCDARTDLVDLATLLTNFGQSVGASRGDGDLNADGAVNLTDLALLLNGFGTVCS